mmetsp:Transcript_6281/g.10901  ORF Transcript_6281/g.10901 Transcript_6281/m.10901 type:complete len:88 (+) Transcript_6281:80-343(+)
MNQKAKMRPLDLLCAIRARRRGQPVCGKRFLREISLFFLLSISAIQAQLAARIVKTTTSIILLPSPITPELENKMAWCVCVCERERS